MKVKKEKTDIQLEHIGQVGERLRMVRESLNMTQKDFAESLNMSNSYYSQVENGNGAPGYDILVQLVMRYNVSLDYVFTGEGSMFFRPDRSDLYNGEYLGEIKEIEDLSWYVNHSQMFKQAVFGYANRYLLNYENLLKKNLERSFKKK